jgi:hypothetical protein
MLCSGHAACHKYPAGYNFLAFGDCGMQAMAWWKVCAEAVALRPFRR